MVGWSMIHKGKIVSDLDMADMLYHQQERRPSQRPNDDRRTDEEQVDELPRDEEERHHLGEGAPTDD